MSMRKIKEYQINQQMDLLKKICQQNVYVAWFDVCFGGDPHGVFSAAMPIEALHSMEGGLIKDSLAILFGEDLKELPCKALDVEIKAMLKWDRQYYVTAGTNKSMPRILFKDGATQLMDLTNADIVGQMLTVVIVSMTDSGSDALLRGFSRNSYSNPVQKLNKLRYIFFNVTSILELVEKTYILETR